MTHSFPTRRSSDLDQLWLVGEPGIGAALQAGLDDAFVDLRVAQQFAGLAVLEHRNRHAPGALAADHPVGPLLDHRRSEEHTSELQSLMRLSYAVFCLQQKTNNNYFTNNTIH